MNIGIDGNEANVDKRVGINKYAFEVIWSLFRLNEKHKKHKLIVYLKKSPENDMPKPTDNYSYRVLGDSPLWIVTKLTPRLWKNFEKVEVIFFPNHYVSPFLTIPSVCSIMDLGYLESSEQFKKLTFWQLKYWTAISVLASKKVLTISNSSKKDIVRHYPFASKKVIVTYPGYDRNIFGKKISLDLVRQVKKRYSIVGDYLLYLGTLKPSKNIEKIIEAYNLLVSDFGNLKLVIAGKKGWLYENIFEKVKKLNLGSKVIFTDFVEESDKPALLAGAKVFVVASLWEGFGLDVVSAMACGVPVVTSKAGSLPEVAGDAGIYVNAKDPESISNGIKKVLKMNQSEYNKLIRKEFKQVKKFSWEKCASKTMEILEMINN